MTRIGPVVEAGELDIEAVNWLVRSEGPGCTPQERAQLEAWLAAPRNRAAYLRMRAAWSHADQLRRLQPLDGSVDPDLLRLGAEPGLRRARPWTEGALRARGHIIGYILVGAALAAVVGGITAWVVTARVL